jgi:hypothetical protein
MQVSCQKNGIFPRPPVQMTSRWKVQTIFCFFSAFTRQIRGTHAYLYKASSTEKRTISGGSRLFIMVHVGEVGGCIPLLPRG